MRLEELTERQRECLRLVSLGLRDKEIGRELGISHETVRKHLKGAMARAGTSSRFIAARALAAHEGAVGLSPPNPSWVPPLRGISNSAGGSEDVGSFDEVRIGGMAGDLHEERSIFQRTPSPEGVSNESKEGFRTSGLTPALRILIALALVLFIAVVITSAIPMSNAFQQIANAMAPP